MAKSNVGILEGTKENPLLQPAISGKNGESSVE